MNEEYLFCKEEYIHSECHTKLSRVRTIMFVTHQQLECAPFWLRERKIWTFCSDFLFGRFEYVERHTHSLRRPSAFGMEVSLSLFSGCEMVSSKSGHWNHTTSDRKTHSTEEYTRDTGRHGTRYGYRKCGKRTNGRHFEKKLVESREKNRCKLYWSFQTWSETKYKVNKIIRNDKVLFGLLSFVPPPRLTSLCFGWRCSRA